MTQKSAASYPPHKCHEIRDHFIHTNFGVEFLHVCEALIDKKRLLRQRITVGIER